MNAAHVYVHVPFCARRCSYCAFAIAVRRSVPSERYVDAVAREMQIRFAQRWQRPVRSLYLGGGTPSHLGGDGVKQLLSRLGDHLDLTHAEITLEANPEDVTDEAIRDWLSAGVNRVSLGVQSLADDALQWMHRVHDAARARSALSLLNRNFERVSADLIFALPETIERDIATDIAEVLASGVGHLSIYGLTAERRTPYARWIDRGQVLEAAEERYESEFLQLHDALTGAGFDHYEVSSFAREGHRSVHNSAYWSGASYAGVGPAAHGFDGVSRRWNVPEFEKWAEHVAAGVDPVADQELLSADNRTAEEVYLGLRTTDGLSIRAGEAETVQRWIAADWGWLDGDRLILNALGWLRLDSLAAALTAVRSR